MVEKDELLEPGGPMPLKCDFWSSFFFLLVLATGAPAVSKGVNGKICSVHSNKEVPMGSTFLIHCIFQKDCKKKIYKDSREVFSISHNSSAVSMSIVNLTQTTTITCKCQDDPEPCGTDITPGYPPEVPQNLTCVQEGELGKVKCTWKTGWETYIQTKSSLRVQGDPAFDFASDTGDDGTLSAFFANPGTQTQLSVWVTATNSLGSAKSDVLSFMLNDIVKPLSPHIKKVECSSRQCLLYPEKAERIQPVEIRYRAVLESWKVISLNHTNSSTSWTVNFLKPYRNYTFQVRWKLSPARGMWSEWSKVENRTDEEAPAVAVDAWYAETSMQTSNKHVQLFWKELTESEAQGKILGYNVSVVDQGRRISEETIKPTSRCYNVPCSHCNISIFAINSKGQSPARLIQLQPIDSKERSVFQYRRKSNYSIALSWESPDSALMVKEYLVEWYPAGLKLDLTCSFEQIQWIRVERHLNTTTVTGLQPAECYDVAVFFLSSSRTRKHVLHNIYTWQSAPQQGPECSATVKNDSVEVKWSEVPPAKRGGCLRKYTIYLQDLRGKMTSYSVKYPRRNYTILGLTLGRRYKLWVSAWTDAGEGPKGNEHNIVTYSITPAGKPLALVVSVGSVVFLTCLFLLCICHFSSVHRRLSQCCHCLMPSIVPDPANSKWAKECASEKGEMKLQLYLSDSSMSEEEPHTVEVQELPQEKLHKGETLATNGSQHPGSNLNVLEPEHHISSSSYQPTTTSSYLKSFSHESTSSDITQASRNTDITVDYISTHGVLSGEEEEDNMDMFNFFPCPTSPFLDPLMSIGGKLTLDTVKIDCDFLDAT